MLSYGQPAFADSTDNKYFTLSPSGSRLPGKIQRGLPFMIFCARRLPRQPTALRLQRKNSPSASICIIVPNIHIRAFRNQRLRDTFIMRAVQDRVSFFVLCIQVCPCPRQRESFALDPRARPRPTFLRTENIPCT
jgi:hypothetical protein